MMSPQVLTNLYASQRAHLLRSISFKFVRFDQGYKEIARKLSLPVIENPETNVVRAAFEWPN